MVRAGTGTLLAAALSAVLSAHTPSPDARARLEQRLRQEGRLASIDAIEEVVWRPRRASIQPADGGYPADQHAHHEAPADDSFALLTLLSGAFVIYAAGPGEADEFTVTVSDTASGRLLKTLTASTGRPGELVLSSPCICRLTASPTPSDERVAGVEQVIALAVLRARGKAGR